MTGASMGATLADGAAPTAHPEQYYELRGHRGYVRDGWEAVALHHPRTPFGDHEWQLFHVTEDPTQIDDRAAAEPGRLDELARSWDEAAWANQVYPMDEVGGTLHAMSPPGRRSAGELVLRPGDHTLEPNLAKALISSRSFTVTVALDFRPGDRGVLVAHGDQGGGYALYVEDDELVLAYNDHGAMTLIRAGRLAAGASEIVADLRAPGGQAWDLSIAVDGEERAAVAGLPMLAYIAPFEGIDVGIDRRSPVSWDVYERHGPFPFTGMLQSVTYTPGEPAPDAPQLRTAELREEALRRFD
jgi:arylsulfatase